MTHILCITLKISYDLLFLILNFLITKPLSRNHLNMWMKSFLRLRRPRRISKSKITNKNIPSFDTEFTDQRILKYKWSKIYLDIEEMLRLHIKLRPFTVLLQWNLSFITRHFSQLVILPKLRLNLKVSLCFSVSEFAIVNSFRKKYLYLTCNSQKNYFNNIFTCDSISVLISSWTVVKYNILSE